MKFEIYKKYIRPLLFSVDSEKIHDVTFKVIKTLEDLSLSGIIAPFFFHEDKRLETTIAGIHFRNPIGLAAGFDKQAYGYDFFSSLGFGSVEVGTITSVPQDGNPKPRIFRLVEDQALINRMGFPSVGIDVVLPRLEKIAKHKSGAVIGVNIGKAKSIPLEEASEDYVRLLKQVRDVADYVAINVSSPNTPELRKLQEPARLTELFGALESESHGKPLFVKIAPDIESGELRNIVEVCKRSSIAGLIATNTTLSREGLISRTDEAGGLSGNPLRVKSLAIIEELSNYSEKTLPIIGVGGISSAEHVIQCLQAGASSVQLYTSLIYEGPMVVNRILKGLSSYLDAQGVGSLSEVTLGKD
jgi:dihydroorotate dehydrogenase